MDFYLAKRLMPTDVVDCPTDRGDEAFRGVVVNVGHAVSKDLRGDEYVSVGVRHPDGHVSHWPSNRLESGPLGLRWRPEPDIAFSPYPDASLEAVEDDAGPAPTL